LGLELKILKSKQGFSLVEGLVALSIMAIAGVGLTNLNVTGMKANKSNEIRGDLQDIKRTIAGQIGCQATFARFGAARPIACSGGQVIKLLDKNGKELAPNNKIGDWTIEAACNNPAGSGVGLSIYATKPITGTSPLSYKKDPLRGLPLDKSHPVSSLFQPGARLCPSFFSSGATVSCSAAGEFVKSVDLASGIVNCGTVPSCSKSESLQFNGNSFACTASTGFAPGSTAGYCVEYFWANSHGGWGGSKVYGTPIAPAVVFGPIPSKSCGCESGWTRQITGSKQNFIYYTCLKGT